MRKNTITTITLITIISVILAACGNMKGADDIMKKDEIFTLEANGRNISGTVYFPEKDNFPVVIFSHGFNGTQYGSLKQARFLQDNGVGVICYDFCGGSVNSKSSLKTTEMTIFTEKEDLEAVIDYSYKLDNVDKDRIYLYGESMGGLVSALVAEEYGDKIKAMALLFPAFCVPDNWRYTFPTEDSIPEVQNLWGVDLGKEFFTSIHNFYVFDNIGKYNGNVFIMHGDNDNIVPLSYSERADKLYKNSSLEVFPNEGHGFSPQGSDTVCQRLLDFVNK